MFEEETYGAKCVLKMLDATPSPKQDRGLVEALDWADFLESRKI